MIKATTLFFFLITVPLAVLHSQGFDPDDLVRIPVHQDFEDGSIDWKNVFFGFEDAMADRVENPNPIDENDSDWVERKIKDPSYLASGVYVYRLQSGAFTQTQKMILVK